MDCAGLAARPKPRPFKTVALTLRNAEPLKSIIMNTGFRCAGCGEWNETWFDESAGHAQTYVEDSQVCCKPNVLHARYDVETQECSIDAELE